MSLSPSSCSIPPRLVTGPLALIVLLTAPASAATERAQHPSSSEHSSDRITEVRIDRIDEPADAWTKLGSPDRSGDETAESAGATAGSET